MTAARAALAAAVLLVLAAASAARPAAGRDRMTTFAYTEPATVREAQEILVALAYLEAGRYKEGDCDRPTGRAIRDFQRDHFLRPNGLLDRDTMALLLSHEPHPKPAKDRAPARPAASVRPGQATAGPPAATDRRCCSCR